MLVGGGHMTLNQSGIASFLENYAAPHCVNALCFQYYGEKYYYACYVFVLLTLLSFHNLPNYFDNICAHEKSRVAATS